MFDDLIPRFHFHDGYENRAVNPLVVIEKLRTIAGPKLDEDYRRIVEAQPYTPSAVEAIEAIQRIAGVVREAFDLPETFTDPDGEIVGLTDAQCLNLFGEFCRHVHNVIQRTKLYSNEPAEKPTNLGFTGRSAFAPASFRC